MIIGVITVKTLARELLRKAKLAPLALDKKTTPIAQNTMLGANPISARDGYGSESLSTIL